MIVSKARYDRMAHYAAELLAYKHSYERLLRKWNELAERINAKGGEAFLQGPAEGPPQLGQEDIRRLLQLCHPDKHQGKDLAHQMTAKLLSMKRSAETPKEN